jgi:hypothetical protein
MPGHDIVAVARPPLRELAERDGLTGVEAALAELLLKAGLRERAPEERPEESGEA